MATVLEAHHTRARDPTLSSAAVAVALAERARSERGRGCGVLAYWSTLRTQRRKKRADVSTNGSIVNPGPRRPPRARVWCATESAPPPQRDSRACTAKEKARAKLVAPARLCVRASHVCARWTGGDQFSHPRPGQTSGLSGRCDGHGLAVRRRRRRVLIMFY